MQQGHQGPGPASVLSRKKETGGTTQPAQKFLDIVAAAAWPRVANKFEATHSGHSATGRFDSL